MPEWLVLVLLVLVLAAAVWWLLAMLPSARGTADQAPAGDTETRVWVACHRPSCGHMEWPHDVTDEGMRCTHCGHLNTPAP